MAGDLWFGCCDSRVLGIFSIYVVRARKLIPCDSANLALESAQPATACGFGRMASALRCIGCTHCLSYPRFSLTWPMRHG